MASVYQWGFNPDDPDRFKVPSVAGLIIAFPSFHDASPILNRPIPLDQSRYNAFCQMHLMDVSRVLTDINSSPAGQAVLAEMQRKNPFSTEIYPFTFAPFAYASSAVAEARLTSDATASGKPGEDRSRAIAQIYRKDQFVCVPVPAKSRNEARQACSQGTGRGDRMTVFYTPDENLLAPFLPADTLVHELVHASRAEHGQFHEGKAGNTHFQYEEFVANLIQNVFRSQRGLAPYDYDEKPIPDNLIRAYSINARPVVANLSKEQPELFNALAKIDCRFNPLRNIV
jgi:hypothetical protein